MEIRNLCRRKKYANREDKMNTKKIKELENQKSEIDKQILKLKSILTIENVYEELFSDKTGYYVDSGSCIDQYEIQIGYGETEYKFKNKEENWFCYYDNTVTHGYRYGCEDDVIYFNSEENIQKAIEIFGEDNIKKMLGV